MINAWELPKTHFPTNDGWILVRDGKNLPVEGQEILFVNDIRGTQEEFHHDVIVRLGNEQSLKVRVLHGYVLDVGFSEELKEWYISVTKIKWQPGMSPWHVGMPDHVTYWRPMPELPEDNYKPSEYSYYDVFKIVQNTTIEETENGKNES